MTPLAKPLNLNPVKKPWQANENLTLACALFVGAFYRLFVLLDVSLHCPNSLLS